jgi:magnesium-transporting ATPase (P-type)
MNRIQKYTIPTTPNAIHGFIFDLAVLAGNIIFAVSILDQTEDLPDRTVGLLMALAIVAQLFGAILKSSPLKQRLWKKPSRSGKGILDKFMDVLLFFHFILFSVVCLLAMDLLGIVNLVDRSASGEDLWVVISLVIAAILTFSVWRAGKRPGESLPETAQHSILQEALADGLLLISVSIITRFFWESWYLELEPSRGIGFSPRAIVLLVGLSLLFVVFYLPSRYLFLVEDYRYLRTWVRMWVAMLPIAWLVLVG